MRRHRNAMPQVGRAILMGLAAMFAAVLACNAPGDDLVININIGGGEAPASDTPAGGEVAEGSMSVQEALAVPPVDGRPEAVRLMGQPDTFRLTFNDVEGATVRLEEWSYYDYESCLDFVDGEYLWTVDIEPLPDGAIFAQYYDPLDFAAHASSAEIRNQLADIALIEEPLDDFDAPGAMILAGPQILLGFENDQLVYVETYALSPEAGQ